MRRVASLESSSRRTRRPTSSRSEVNPSYYCFRTDALLSALARVGNANASREYYLTDVFAILRGDGLTVAAVDAVPPEDILSINDPAQLAEVDAILRARLAGGTR